MKKIEVWYGPSAAQKAREQMDRESHSFWKFMMGLGGVTLFFLYVGLCGMLVRMIFG